MIELNGTIIAVLINFGVLVYLMNLFLYKPVLDMLDKRKATVEGTLSGADAKMSAAKAFYDEGRASIDKANATAKEIIDGASGAAEKIREEAEAALKVDLDDMKKRAKDDIKQYRSEARKQMLNETAALSVMIAEKIIRKNLNARTQRTVIDDFIKELDR